MNEWGFIIEKDGKEVYEDFGYECELDAEAAGTEYLASLGHQDIEQSTMTICQKWRDLEEDA